MSDFVFVLKLYSREICFQCKLNLPSEERRSTWSDFLLSYVKPYTNIVFCIFSQKYFLFYKFFTIFFSLQVKHVLPRTAIFKHFVWKRVFSRMFWQVYMKIKVTSWKKTQATVRRDLQHINNLFGLFLTDLEKKPPCHSIVRDMVD